MARNGLREYHAKQILGSILPGYGKMLTLVTPNDDLANLQNEHPWLKSEKLVVKPDQLFGKRGKHGLIGVNLNVEEVKEWIKSRMGKTQTIGKISDKLTHFLIEPFIEHKNEYYVALSASNDRDVIYLSAKGGVDVEENWDHVKSLEIVDGETLDVNKLSSIACELFDKNDQKTIIDFVTSLYALFTKTHFTYLEINPFTIVNDQIKPLDMVAKVDDTARFMCMDTWGKIETPTAFGTSLTKEEAYIQELDSQTGASLKLSVLKPEGRIWTMVAGGGASVIYADTISDLGWGHELANYGEYSGDPNTEMTYQYAKTILDLMTREKASKDQCKYLFIGGGIANFTDVAKTFTGIIKAIREYTDKLKATNVQIYIRRGGPNYKEGLEKMRALGSELGLPINVYGPETHMTKIVSLALQA